MADDNQEATMTGTDPEDVSANREGALPPTGREAAIVRASVTGIVANVLLAGFKAVVGTLSHSIAITLDAVNNLSDALSSVITIVGTKLAGRAPDRKHPMGYGRVEYLSAAVISVIVLYAGITSVVEHARISSRPRPPTTRRSRSWWSPRAWWPRSSWGAT